MRLYSLFGLQGAWDGRGGHAYFQKKQLPDLPRTSFPHLSRQAIKKPAVNERGRLFVCRSVDLVSSIGQIQIKLRAHQILSIGTRIIARRFQSVEVGGADVTGDIAAVKA